tara:strand:+ start:91 stop:1341 length:1251 start_codon:yes stop_codon:yes gene_type:complete
MKICIHRGTQEIGGTCIELEAQGKRIALDIGMPLDADQSDDPASLLPPVRGFRESDDDLLGVVVSHPHIDHFGLASFLRPDLPVYIGEAASNILKAASRYVPGGIYFENAAHYSNGAPTEIGPFTITPYLMDHSAYDAYGLLIAAGDKRIYYSGDFRGHGRKRALFEAFLSRPPQDLDVLMMEGTTIGREGTDGIFPSESDLEDVFISDIEKCAGMYLVYASSQNIDRIVTLFRAAKRTGRKLVMDLYSAAVLKATGNDRIPQSDWDDVRLYVPFRQRILVKKKELFADLNAHNSNRVFDHHLKAAPKNYVLLFRPGMHLDKGITNASAGARFAYSMWGGYLAQEKMGSFKEWLAERDISLTHIHTSGHAGPSDLKRLAAALAPKKLVPIHSFETGRFAELFDNVETKQDGEWWSV